MKNQLEESKKIYKKILCKIFFWAFSNKLPQEVPKIVCLFMSQKWLDPQTYWKRNDFSIIPKLKVPIILQHNTFLRKESKLQTIFQMHFFLLRKAKI
jgi:hypothetical protein